LRRSERTSCAQVRSAALSATQSHRRSAIFRAYQNERNHQCSHRYVSLFRSSWIGFVFSCLWWWFCRGAWTIGKYNMCVLKAFYMKSFFSSYAADLARIEFGTHLAARFLFETCLCVQVKREFRWEMPAGSSTAWSMGFSLMDVSLGELLTHFLKGRVCRGPSLPVYCFFWLRMGVEEKKRPIFRLYSS
jgi:hypothetical protein